MVEARIGGANGITDAFILAAGLGTRMRPLTDTLPKPLVNVAGKALLDHALDAVERAGLDHCVVNVHHLAEQIEAHLANRRSPRITISDERHELLDSGGGVARGLPHMRGDAIVVLNGDSFWVEGSRDNLPAMLECFEPEQMDILMLLAPTTGAVGFDGRGDFFMDQEGHLSRRGESETAPFVYAGAMIVQRGLFEKIDQQKFSLNVLFDLAIERNRLFGLRLDGLWLHVGTIDAIGEAEEAIKRSG